MIPSQTSEVPDQAAAAPPAAETPPADAGVGGSEPGPKDDRPSLAETIRSAREAREARAAAAKAAADKDRELAELKAEIGRLRAEDPAADPVGWARGRKWDKETQLLVGQTLLYDLAPDKAPGDLRVKLLEARIARERAEESSKAEEKARRAEAEAARSAYEQYETTVRAASRSLDPDTYPESADWFGDDRDTYARSLLATARNMAESARSSGRQADLHPANVAKVLEAELSARAKARDDRRARRALTKQDLETGGVPAGEGGERSAGNVASTKGLSTAGTPRPKALTDRERVQRAIEAGFVKRVTA